MTTQRHYLWDNLRFILILSLVIGNMISDYTKDFGTFQSLFLFLNAFQTPLFFYLFGLAHRNKDIPEKILSYLSIYMLMKICAYWIRLAFGMRSTIPVFYESGFVWMMLGLAIFTLITYLFRSVNPRYLLLFALILGCICGYDKELGKALCLYRVLVFYPFYLMGSMTDREAITKLRSRSSLRIGAAAILIIWAAICLFLRRHLTELSSLMIARNHYADEIWSFGAFYRLALYILAILLVFSLIMLTPSRPLGPITSWGRRLLQIYFWHYLPLLILNYTGFTEKFLHHGAIGKVSWLLLAVILTGICGLPVFRQPVAWIFQAPYKKAKE